MYAVITDDKSGDQLAIYTLLDQDLLDPDVWAARFVSEWGGALAAADGYIPLGCGDFTVTVREDPGSVICWSAKSYFIESET